MHLLGLFFVFAQVGCATPMPDSSCSSACQDAPSFPSTPFRQFHRIKGRSKEADDMEVRVMEITEEGVTRGWDHLDANTPD